MHGRPRRRVEHAGTARSAELFPRDPVAVAAAAGGQADRHVDRNHAACRIRTERVQQAGQRRADGQAGGRRRDPAGAAAVDADHAGFSGHGVPRELLARIPKNR